ncbi:DUF5691 domain-containing protein [Nocardiopsis baichengensis]|uniref:DUF5691 domain-containing protein n=1 Tax=Nocardiopsis baichengensis TaxID=280240 RepID=UPI00034AF187|nr:DUF5691 domain-containing protein [Nocardiopsis baichengensis]
MPWDALVAAALVGTSRAGVPGGEGTAGHPALDLLDRAALAVVRDRAGVRPLRAPDTEPLPPAPAESAPWVPRAAGEVLDDFLERDDTELIAEWLDLARARAALVPPSLLPGLLEAGSRHRALRTAIAAASGERGRWLASLSADWSWLAGLHPSDGRPDTSPERWAHEDDAGRRRLLISLEEHLSPADEDFLSRALRAPSPGVRALASALLARLPRSERGDALARRVRAHVRPGPDGRPSVRLPDPADRALGAALGLRPRPSSGVPASADLRREWLWTLVAHAPLRTWTGHLGDDRAEVVRAASSARDWDLLDALANAAVVQRDREWADALAGPVMERLLHGRSVHGSRGPALLALLPAERRCAWAVRAVGDAGAPSALPVLDHVPGPWSEELAAAAARAIDTAADGAGEAYLPELCRVAARRMPPGAGARPRRPRPGDHPRTAAALADMEAVLRLRLRIHEELQ